MEMLIFKQGLGIVSSVVDIYNQFTDIYRYLKLIKSLNFATKC